MRTYPVFYAAELARVNSRSRTETKKAINDLLGIICETVRTINKERYERKIFLPPSRKELAEYLLRRIA